MRRCVLSLHRSHGDPVRIVFITRVSWVTGKRGKALKPARNDVNLKPGSYRLAEKTVVNWLDHVVSPTGSDL